MFNNKEFINDLKHSILSSCYNVARPANKELLLYLSSGRILNEKIIKER